MPTGINKKTNLPNMQGKTHSQGTKQLIREKLRKGSHFKCEYCNGVFYRSPSTIKRRAVRFCSKQCAGKHMRGKLKNIKPLEEKEWRITRGGYLSTTVRRKRVLQHRWIMEKHIKRKLLISEKVHHVNGIKTDNRIENLVIMGDSEHSKTHKQLLKENAQMRMLLKQIYNDPKELNKHWLNNVRYHVQSKL